MNEDSKTEIQALRKSVQELTILNAISAAITSTMKVEEISNLILSKCTDHVEAEQGSITLLAGSEMMPTFRTMQRVIDKKMGDVPYRLGASLSGWMLKNQEPLLIDDIASDNRFKGISSESGAIKSMVSVPLKVKDKMIGLITLFNKKSGKFTPEDQRFLSIVASQSAQVLENARLYEEEQKLKFIEAELKTAQNIQKALLPKNNPTIPGIDIAGTYYPAREVGGDFFDYIQIDENRLGVAIGDVSGKGLPAALLMSHLHASLRSTAPVNVSAKNCVTKTNDLLCQCIAEGKFITMFYGILNTSDRSFLFTNAGHNYPLLFSKEGDVKRLETKDLIMGVMHDFSYKEKSISLNPGEIIVLYTDGVTEAENTTGEQFEEKRVIDVVTKNSHLSSAEICEKLFEEVQSFQKDEAQQDDFTVVIIKV